ncbi:MAG: hypothetical protein ACPHDT_05200, partial [Acidimicrobiales bacterium]
HGACHSGFGMSDAALLRRICSVRPAFGATGAVALATLDLDAGLALACYNDEGNALVRCTLLPYRPTWRTSIGGQVGTDPKNCPTSV